MEATMGLLDTVRIEPGAPGADRFRDCELQTSDLGRRMERFTIIADGRLIHHRVRYDVTQASATAEISPLALWRVVPDRDVVVPLHRDVTLYGEPADGEADFFVARFTEGRLQWIKPRDQLDEDYREYLWASD